VSSKADKIVCLIYRAHTHTTVLWLSEKPKRKIRKVSKTKTNIVRRNGAT